MRIVLAVLATAAAAIVLAPPAQADGSSFQSPSGNIACQLGAAGVACDIRDYTYQPPPPPLCAQHISWGNRFVLEPGKAGTIVCHGDSVRVPGEPTLDYGQTASAGTLSCASEASGVRCTDSSSGHYFRVSRDSYDLG
jgi:hypothetical protein